jgi:hypothetical protein
LNSGKDQEEVEKFINILETILEGNVFQSNNKIYKQTFGTPMGSPLSPVIANIYMEDFEERALKNSLLKPKLWLRYVDDILIVWPHSNSDLELFLEFLNNIEPTIQFTYEKEENGSLPFLDVLLTRSPNNTIQTTVYRKPTHTNQYLHATSCHHPQQKLNVLKTLYNRATSVCSSESTLKSEMNTLKSIAHSNGFTHQQHINSITKQPKISKYGPKRKKAFIPFHPATYKQVAKNLNKYAIETVFIPPSKIYQILPSSKDKISISEKRGIYKIPCGDCSKVYIGQTTRNLGIRIKEHKDYLRLGHPEKSGIANHAFEKDHCITWNDAKIISQPKTAFSLNWTEAIEIIKHPNNTNQNSAFKIPYIWNTFFKN